MKPGELYQAIEKTKEQIHQLQQRLNNATDPGEKLDLKTRLKELRRLQFSYINQLG